MLKKTILAALLCSAIMAEAGAAEIKYTYAGNDYGNWGTGKKENYDVAMRINDPELVGKKITAINASLFATENISSTSVWLSKELKLEKKVNVPDISIAATPNRFGEMNVKLDAPYTITSEGVYVGYSFAVDELDDNTSSPLLLSTNVNENGFYLHTSRTVIKWLNYGTDRISATAVIEVTIEGDFPENAVGIKKLPIVYGEAGASTTVAVDILNYGSKPLTDIDYSYTIDGVTKNASCRLPSPVATDYVNASPVVLSFEMPENIGEYPFSVTIDKVNGMANASAAKSASTSLNTVSFVPRHRPVMEEYTGTWCGWCPRGWLALEKMNELYGSDFIGIAYHSGDPMETVAEDDYPVLVDGFPSATIDRGPVTDPYYGNAANGFGIETEWKNARDQFATASISLYAWWADAEKTKIEAASFTRFVKAETDADYALSYVLCADDLHSTDEDWDQSNYFAQPKYAPTYEGTELEVLCKMPESINDLHFNEVALIADTPEGIEGSIPATIELDKKIEDRYTFDTSDVKALIQNPDKLFVVAMVLDGKTGKIVNAIKAPVTAEAGIENVMPAEGVDTVSVRYTDLQGRVVKSPRAGIYVKTVRFSDGSVKSEKLFVK